MNIAVFGSGVVGRVIADRLLSLNHHVTMGTRVPKETLTRSERDRFSNQSFSEWYAGKADKIAVRTYAEAAAAAEVIFNCTQGMASVDALKLAGSNALAGKVLIDLANPLDFSKGMPPSLSPVNTDSLGELIQRTFPDLRVIKALNTMTCFIMVNPASVPGDHNVFVCGNDQSAKNIAGKIIESFGWKNSNIIDLGDISASRGTEQLLPIWLRLMGTLKTPMFNFNVVKA